MSVATVVCSGQTVFYVEGGTVISLANETFKFNGALGLMFARARWGMLVLLLYAVWVAGSPLPAPVVLVFCVLRL